jgi:hypothetical protein
MDERLVGRNRKYHAGWRHFTEFVQGGTGAPPARSSTLKPSTADGEEQGGQLLLTRRQRQAAASLAEDEDAAEEGGGAAGASSVAALLAAAEGKMVISDALRGQYQERVAASAKVCARMLLCGYFTHIVS